jgi:two-component system, cell cycle response regulator CpdR
MLAGRRLPLSVREFITPQIYCRFLNRARDRRVDQAATVLFVEDDEMVRNLVAQALWARGFRVFVTENAYEAMRLLAQEHVDVLFADIVMPSLDGIELVRQAQLSHPDLKVMLTTGYLSRAVEGMSVARLLFKPLRADQIEAEIRDLLTAPN